MERTPKSDHGEIFREILSSASRYPLPLTPLFLTPLPLPGVDSNRKHGREKKPGSRKRKK